MHKYIGKTVELIYIDRKGKISQRRVVVKSADDRVLRGYCLTKMAPRPFLITNILAIQAVTSRAV